MRRSLVIGFAAAMLAVKPCAAGFIQYFTDTVAPIGTIDSDILGQPQTFNVNRPAVTNSQAGFDAFIQGAFNNLGTDTIFGIESFERFLAVNPTNSPAGMLDLDLRFNQYFPSVPGVSPDLLPSSVISADLSGTAVQVARIDDSNVNSAGRFPVTLPERGIGGVQYLDTNFANLAFTIDFGDTPVDGFGFFGTDLGDFNGLVQLMITDVNGNLTAMTVPHDRHPLNPANPTTDRLNANLLFFGLVSDIGIAKIDFVNLVTNQGDRFGFDNFVVALSNDTPPNAVPEPQSLMLFFVGAVGLVFGIRRKERSLCGNT